MESQSIKGPCADAKTTYCSRWRLVAQLYSILAPSTAARGTFRVKKETKTYNSEDSLMVTHPTTNSPACGLSTAERTGSPIFHTLWSYVPSYVWERNTVPLIEIISEFVILYTYILRNQIMG
ncbi:hypothetical protein ACN38_g11299 [Penicillium nordicum]|uniref:Uncharacterized protein n=1 Tax=Penicillium nordicum TaxID=229535 RepID=A0A0M8P0F3_9EURO|nr:hypothetical protein ACN38_g11299 [Penicillium nordicum]